MSEDSWEPQLKSLESLKNKIADLIERETHPPRLVSPELWQQLRDILVSYLDQDFDFSGLASARDVALLEEVIQHAKELQKSLDQLCATDAAWLTRFSPSQLSDLDAGLGALIDIQVPKGAPRDLADAEVGTGTYRQWTRARLQANLDQWWMSATDLPKGSEDPGASFYQFLRLVFASLPEEQAPGSTPTAVKQRRRETRQKIRPPHPFREPEG